MKQETKERLKEFSINYGKKITAGLLMGSVIGLGVSFLPVSPLLMGAIIAAVPAILFTLYLECKRYIPIITACKGNSNSINEVTSILAESLFKSFLSTCIVATVGIGIAAGICALIPGAMVAMAPAALTGAAIGITAVVAKDPIQERIISPIVEQVSKRFSSRGVEGPSI